MVPLLATPKKCEKWPETSMPIKKAPTATKRDQRIFPVAGPRLPSPLRGSVMSAGDAGLGVCCSDSNNTHSRKAAQNELRIRRDASDGSFLRMKLLIENTVHCQFPRVALNRSHVPSAGCHTALYGLSVQTTARIFSRSRTCRASCRARMGAKPGSSYTA